MKIWITKNSEIPVRDQIVSQIRVAIASGDLRPGDRLPSTRELARRFNIHANTVSAAYRELTNTGAVENRKGSGIYIRENGADGLDVLLERLFRDAAKAGFPKETVFQRILNSVGTKPTSGFVLFEPNEDLAEILVYEIKATTGIAPRSVAGGASLSTDSTLIALFDEEPKIREAFGRVNCVLLSPNSVACSLSGRARPQRDALVVAASGWEDFLLLAHLFLIAAGVESDPICICSTHEPEWTRGLRTASMIICDSVTAMKLPDDSRLIVFPVISPNSLDELRRIAAGSTVAPSISIPTARS